MLSVLYYDRDPAWRRQAERWLARDGSIEVVPAGTFDEAVVLFRERVYDVVVAAPLEEEVLSLLSFIRPEERAVPFFLLMEPGHEAVVIKALNSGADRYVEKSGDPAERLGTLAGTIEETVVREQESVTLQRRNEELEFLSKTAMDFIRMEDDADIYHYIIEQVHGLAHGLYECIMLFDRDSRRFIIQDFIVDDSVAGIPEEELGRDPVGMSFPLDRVPSAEAVLGCDRLVEVVTSLYQGLFMTLPKEVCERIEERVDAGKFHTMGFNCREGLYGTLTIVVRKGGELAHRELIEAFVRQASVALLRQHVRVRLKESEARYRAVVESQEELICRFSPDGTHRFANEAYCRFFGLDPDAVVGSRFSPAVPEEERRALRDYFRGFAPDRPDGTIEHRVVDTNGSARWLQWSDRAFFDRDGAIAEFQSVGRDVTERKEAEEALAALTAGLEQRVEERTAELQAANRDLESFTHSVSHDLRAPLRAIDGYLGLYMAKFGPEIPADGVVMIGNARDGVYRADRFIGDLLTLARVRRQEARREPVEPAELARSVIAELELAADGRRVEYVVREMPGCMADPILLRHVYQNLIANAIKFTRPREVAAIECDAEAGPDGTRYFVRDNGVGFDQTDADRLFEPFARFHEARRFEGSGIGLALVKLIVERHGGRVWAEGEVDRGATFSFTLGA